jgi:transketolase
MEKASFREAFGKTLMEVGAKNPDVVVLVADVSSSVMTNYFAEKFPERFFNVGIQEAGMVDVAVGFALAGMIPFVNTFAGLFLRTMEQIRTCVAYAKTDVKLVGGYCGVSDFKDGPTHHSIVDIAIMRAMPNLVVVGPADATEVKKILPLVAEYDGPVYMRISRADTPLVFDEDYKVEIGRGVVVQNGDDLTLIGNGVMLFRCLEAAKILAKEGVSCRVINIHTVKPLDISLLQQAAEETGAIVSAEEHSIMGGLGSAVAEALVGFYPVPLEQVGIADTFAETALDFESLLDHYGMGVEDIVEAAHRALRRKEKRCEKK